MDKIDDLSDRTEELTCIFSDMGMCQIVPKNRQLECNGNEKCKRRCPQWNKW